MGLAGAEPGVSATEPRTIRFSDNEPRVALSLQPPAAFPSTVSWMWAGLREYPVTSIVALAVGWLTVYSAVWLAGLGALVGLMVGVVLTFLAPTTGAAARAPSLAPTLGL